MSKIEINDLILLQKGEVSNKRKLEIENELLTNKKLKKEYEQLIKADEVMETYFQNFQMPNDFKQEVKKKFKKEFNLFSFFDSKTIVSYGSGLVTACFMFAIIYSVDPFLQLQGQRNNDIIIRGNVNKNLDIEMPKQWLVNEYLNFQMVKFSENDKKSISIGQNQSLSIGDAVLIRIIPNKNITVSFELQNRSKTTIIKKDFTLIKGQELLLPESIISSQRTFEVEGPSGVETFLIKNQNNKVIFKLEYKIE